MKNSPSYGLAPGLIRLLERMQNNRIIIFTLSAMLLLCGCWRNPNYSLKFGVGYNGEREKRGIPTIPSTWTVQDMGSYFDCFDPKPNQKAPHRLSKRVFVKNCTIVSEVDTFYNGKTFYYEPGGITLPQEISVEYDYGGEKEVKQWKAHTDLNATERSKSISIEEAVPILRDWGLWK